MINNYDSVETRYSTGSTSSLKQEDISYTAKKRTWLSFITLFVALFSFVFAQGQSSANYSFTTGASTLNSMTGGTVIMTGVQDDTGSTVYPIGFNFIYMGSVYSHFSVNSNGQMRLHASAGATAMGGSSVSAYAASTVTLAPMAGDNEVGNGMSYLVSGSAPNRKLVIEWNNFYANWTDPQTSGNMQLVLNEGTGVFEFLYGGILNSSTSTVTKSIFHSSGNTANSSSYITVGATPTQTTSATAPVTNTFAASVQIANLANTYYRFTPPVPASGPTALIFSGVTAGGMTLDWTTADPTNIARYIVSNSTNGGTTYNFISNVAVGTNTYTATNLVPGTIYDWKVVAVSEGVEATPATSSQATNPPGVITSIASGNWSQTTTWSTGTIPTATDNVIIADGHTVNIDITSPTCLDLTVGQGTSGILTFTSTAASTLIVNGSITVAAGANFNAGITTNIHNIYLGGATATSPYASNLIVDGTFDMWVNSSIGRATLTFFGSQNSTISGSGTIDLNNTNIINKGATTATALVTPPVLDVQKAFTVQAASTLGFVATHTAGTIKISGTYTQSNPIFTSTGYTIPATGGIWLNNPNFTIAGQAGSPTVNGLFKVTAGTYNIGTASGNSVGSGTNSIYIIEGGAINVAGRFNLTSTGVYYNQSGGIISVATIGNTSVANAAFGVTSATSSFIMSGGTIVLVQRNGGTLGTTTRDYYVAATPTITGGTLQVGTAATATNFNFRLYGNAPSIVINNTTNNKKVEVHQSSGLLKIYGTLTVNIGTTFDCLGMPAYALGNVVNDGIIQGTTSGSRFNFEGTTAQTYSGAGTFGTALAPFAGNGVGILNYSNVTLNSPLVTTIVNLFGGSFINSNQITIGNGGTSTGLVQRGGGTAAAGSFDVSPTFNVGSGGLTLNYTASTVNTTTGYEIPSSRAVNSFIVNNTNGVILAGGAASSGSLTLTLGNLTTTATDLFTVSGTTTGSIVGGSTTSYVNGPLAITLPAPFSSGSTYSFPIGKGSFNKFELVNPITINTGTVTVKAEVFDAPTGGSLGTLIGALNSNRYWAASITNGNANFTSSSIKLNDAPNGADAIASSTTLTGAYSIIGTTPYTFTSTATSLASTTPVSTSLDGFYVMGAKAAATLATPAITPSGNQCTNVSRAISVLITPGGGAITTVVLNYSINGVAQTAITMANSTNNGGMMADTWTATIPTVTPTNATVTWSVTATDANNLSRDINGASYTDEPNLGVITTASASSATTCSGDSTTLSVGLNRTAIGVQGAGALTGSSTGNTIFPGFWGGAKSQYLIKASELSALGLVAGNISSIGFEPTTSGQTYQGFQLWANQTTATALTSTFLANGTLVYLATGTDNGYVPTANAVNTLAFGTGAGASSSFYWDGVSNVVLTFSWTSVPSAGTSTSSSMKYDTISYNACTYKQADNLTPAAMLANTTGTTSTSRPRFTFNTNSAPTPTSYSWSDGTTVVGTTSSLTVNPTATTTYTVTAIGNNCPLTASTTVTVNPLPTAPTTIASTQCGAGLPPATAADPNGFTAPTFNWYAASTGGAALFSSTNATYGLPVSASTTLYVSVVNPTTNCESARTAVAITVNTADVLGISGAPTANVCLGQSFELTPTQTGSNGNVFALTWAASTAGSGLTASTAAILGQAVTVTPTAAGTYTYSINGSEASSGCTGAASTASITVINPNAGISATAAASSATVCSGSDTSLSLSFSNAAASTLYSTPSVSNPTSDEDFGNVTITQGATTILNNTSVINSLSGTIGTATGTAGSYSNFTAFGPYAMTAGQSYDFSVSSLTTGTAYSNSMAIFIDLNRDGDFADANEIVYAAGSTTSGAHTETGSFTIPSTALGGLTRMRVVNNEGSIASSTPSVSYGEYEDYMLDITSTNSGGGASITAPTAYSWSNGSTVVGTTNPAVVNPVSTTIYTGTATVNGCPISASTTVTTNPLPTALTAFNSNQCGLGVPTASVADNNGYTTPTIKWYAAATGGTALQSSTATSYLTAINTTTTFYVSVADPVTNCESPRTAVTVSVIVPDVISATATPSTICLGQSFALAAANTASTPTQNYTYSWLSTTGSGLETAQSGATATVTPTAAGTYTYTITGIDGICTQINTVAVTVNPIPAIATASVDPTVACAGSTINLGATITSIAAGTSTLGTGTTASSSTAQSFFPGFWGGAKTQYLITASELTALGYVAGNITSVGFNPTTSGQAYTGFQLWVDQTVDTSLTTTFLPLGTQVYLSTNPNNAYTPVANSLNTLQFGTGSGSAAAFNWDGVSNLVLTFSWSSVPAAATASGSSMYVNSPGYTCSAYEQSDNLTPADQLAKTTADGTGSSRPNFTFGGQLLTNTTSNYNWSWSDGSTSVLTTAAGTTILPATTTTYTVTATNPTTGCTASQNFTVTSNPLPLAPVATNSVQCGSQTPTASVTDSNNFSYPYINWYASATATTPLQSSISNTFSNTVSATTTFYVTVVNPATNCESPRTPVLVTVNIPDAIAANASPTTLCLGQTVTLTSGNTATTPTQNYTYSWASTTDSGLENPVPGVNALATPTAAGSYVYTVTATDVVTTCVITNSVTVTVNPVPAITSATANPSIACAGSTIALDASIISVQAGTSTLGTGTTTSSSTAQSFFPGFWGGAKTQYLIKASELTALGYAAGNITSIGFDPTTSGQAYTGFQLWVDQTVNSSLTTTFLPLGTQVYLSTNPDNAYTPVANSLNTLPFGTGTGSAAAFNWDGVSNLVLTFSWSSVPAATTATGSSMYVNSPGYTCSAYEQSDSLTPAEQLAKISADGTGTNRPNFTFGGQIAADVTPIYSWLWTTGSTSVLTAASGTTILPTGATTTYTVTATNPSTGCSSSQNVLVSTNIAPLAVAAVTTTSSSICIGSSTTLSAAPTGGCIPYTYSWSNGTSVVGTSATLTVSPTTTTTYTLTVTDNAGTIVTVPSLITVNNPQPTSVAGQTICANSAAFTLTATPSSTSNSVNWFADQTSTAVLSTSSSFTTPVLTAPTTTYYVEERANDPELSGNGIGTTTLPNSTFWSSQRGIVFTATKPFKLVSAEYHSQSTNSSNTVSISLVDDASGTTVSSTSVTIPQGANPSWYTMNINFDVVPGTYRLLASYSQSADRVTTGVNYPYTLGTSGSITSGYNFGIDSASYNYFHNITIQEFCAGTRVPVTATLNAPPALAISGATTTICEADSTAAVSVTTGAADYDQYTWSPATGVTSGTNGWTFNPTTTTTYTLTASQSAGTCSNTAAYVVNVNPLPSAITITPAAPSICVGDTQMLTAVGGLMNNVVILSENFNASSNSWTAINNSTGGTPANSDWTLSPNNYVYGGFTTFSSNDASQFYLSNSDSQGSGGTTETQLVSPSFSTLSYTNATLKFYQYYRASGTAAVEYSIDGGTNWVSLSSYTNTIGTSTSFVQQTVTLPAGALNQANVKVRFKYSDSYGWYWAVDNVLISGTQGLPITWSPVTDLYTNAAATIPYVAGTNATTVYVKSAQAGSQTYTTTSVSTLGCIRTATVPVIVNALPTVVTNAVSVCAPATVDLTAASVTAGSSTDITTLTYWTDAAATVALANPSAVAVSGTYYIVASNANGCSSSITPVTVAVNPLPVLTITNPATACFPATVDLTAAAVTAGSDAVGMTLSYFTDAAATTALATPAAVTTSGTYYIKITNNATGCNVISPVVVTIDVTSAPTGAAAQTFCGAANLSDLSVNGSNIRWYSAATGGVEYPASIWSAVGLVNGTIYYASQTVNGCESAPRIAVTVTINAIPSAPNASAQSFCGSATVADLVPSGSSLTWYDVATGGSALTSSTALVSATYYVSQTSNGCEGTRTAVAVTVNGTALPTASAQTFCGPVTVASLVASGASINWYDVATGGAALAGSTSLSTGTYYVTQTLNGCESPRLSVAVTVNTVAAPSGAAVQDACITETIADFVVTGDTGAVLTWYATSTSTTSIPTSTPAVLNTFYYVSQTVNGCEGPRLVVIASGPCLGNEEFDMTSFSYYPNPTRDIVNISYSKEITQIKVFNMLGQQVIDTKVNSTTTQVDLSRFATGTYFIEVTSDEVSKTVKVIKN